MLLLLLHTQKSHFFTIIILLIFLKIKKKNFFLNYVPSILHYFGNLKKKNLKVLLQREEISSTFGSKTSETCVYRQWEVGHTCFWWGKPVAKLDFLPS